MSIIDIGVFMATNVHLTAELESFARACVEGGKYNNVSEVVRAGLRLLHDAEERRRGFNAMLEAVRTEADRDGVHDLDGVLNEMDGIIDEAAR
jgi:antitoxin ParD1/3/4